MAAPTRFVNPNAEVVSKTQALMVNVAAARGLQNVLKTNLGERCSSRSRKIGFLLGSKSYLQENLDLL